MKTHKRAKIFNQPIRLMNDEGKIRKAGFELEFSGIPLKEVVAIVVDLFGGRPESDDSFYQKITGSRYGDFSVELDAYFFKKRLYKSNFEEAKTRNGEVTAETQAALNKANDEITELRKQVNEFEKRILVLKAQAALETRPLPENRRNQTLPALTQRVSQKSAEWEG